jgi:hypothetical protein
LQSNAKPAIFYITTDTVAFLPLDFYSPVPDDIPVSPPEYRPAPEAPTIPIEKNQIELPKITIEKVENLSPEEYLKEVRSIRSQNAKDRYAWGRKVEKEIAPRILQRLGFTDIRAGNGRPIDLEAWRDRIHYAIDVKYLAQMPGIIKKLATLVVPPPEISISRIRKRKKESDSN